MFADLIQTQVYTCSNIAHITEHIMHTFSLTVAFNSNILCVCTVVNAPVTTGAIGQPCFCTYASYIIQPNWVKTTAKLLDAC